MERRMEAVTCTLWVDGYGRVWARAVLIVYRGRQRGKRRARMYLSYGRGRRRYGVQQRGEWAAF